MSLMLTTFLFYYFPVIKILPTHWVQRIIEIVSFQISQHNFSQIPQLCTLNGQRFTSLPHMVSKNIFLSIHVDRALLNTPMKYVKVKKQVLSSARPALMVT